MGLLRADLQALANLPATAAGRRQLLGTLFGLGMLGALWWSVVATMHQDPHLVAMLHRSTHGLSLPTLLGTALLPCPIAATWLGLALAQRQLFEAPELLLWRSAPIAGWRAPLQVLLRASFLSLLWASALAAPWCMTLLAEAGAGPLAYCLLPVALVAGTVPLLAMLLAVQIVLVRFFAGRVLRLVLAATAALASVGFSTWLLLGLFGSAEQRLAAPATTGAPHLPWTIEAMATLLATAARGQLEPDALRQVLGWLGLSLALFWFAARLHPRAVERHLAAESPLRRRRRGGWPTSLAAVVRRKELAQVLQQPGALLGFVTFAVLVFALADRRVLVGPLLADRRLPAELAQVAAMATLWFLAVMLVLYAHMGRLALWDGPQWSLYQSAPALPRTILRGKLEATAVLLAWPLLLVAAGGAHWYGASPRAVLTFVGIAVGGTLTALGVLAVVGTSPRLVQPTDGAIAQGGRGFVAALVLVLGFQLALAPALFAWFELERHLRTTRLDAATVRAFAPWVVGGALLHGLVVAALGTALGARNFRRLLAPR